ncbi:glycoside hydrolase family 13 protein [Chitinophaga agrisoli]|uniref:Glycoside hydrolase family 13 protein n=1 Tax=Chitinophaga agrisoli TaxID=2607653 RepID=A0A5B2VK86_9BACT|nr:glycoside hydrolase family 13 protein [Chitinophaga agrisoli]KAA2240013.1 glycoside hydrolase family 13 protein [Chitinophaga agrisoli]
MARLKICLLTITIFLLSGATLFAQLPALERIEPAFWWTGMHNPVLQLIVHGDKIAERNVQLDYPGVTLKEVHKVENPNYLFVDLEIGASAKPGSMQLRFSKTGAKEIRYEYALKARDNAARAQGVTNKDLVYLIMPDRFANGDKTNDIVKGMQQTTLNRDSMYYRHGGDLQGIIDHLDYLQDLGITALWLNPVLENDQPSASYHGYAATENYRIDRRYGNNELYKKLVDELHKRGMKMIQDLVHNHIGSRHWTMLDLPSKDWVHQWPVFTRSNFREQPLFDPYAAAADKKLMTDGWFDTHMPDMNQANPYVRNYFTQSHIWWIEYAGVDGFRLDTYGYNDAAYMQEWGKAVKAEYPQLSFFGETFVHGVPNQAVFTQGNTINRGFDTDLPGVTDFQFLWAMTDLVNTKTSAQDGVAGLYNTLSNDFVYQDATRNVTFLDNHDLSRFFSVAGENIPKYKLALGCLLTTRGIPQLYYGAEILMKNFSNPDGLVREDFKGGWQGDSVNKFQPAGRTAAENEVFDYVHKLANYRKQDSVLQTGRLMQYVPEKGMYVYFRYNDHKTVMIIVNANDKEQSLVTQRFTERLQQFSHATDIITGKEQSITGTITVPALTTQVLELK